MTDATNVVLVGPNGLGKSMFACNLALPGADRRARRRCSPPPGSCSATWPRSTATPLLRRRMRHYAAPDLLLVDEVGYLSYSNRHADLLFELISRRYEHKSTVITTNRAFKDWGEVFPNAACTVSLIDRLMHRARWWHRG
jgi:DNA replication protein DnaC